MADIPLDRRLVLALDTPDRESALDLVRRTRQFIGTYKVGLGLYTAVGPSIIERLRRDGADVFLDLKMHDIPSTVGAAVRAAAKHGVSLLTVHSLGGPKMLEAAKGALSEQTAIPGQSLTRVLGVSILTHHTGNELRSLGLDEDPDEAVVRLTKMSHESGLDGCVCSPEEAAAVRAATDEDFVIVCPGIRPEGAPLGDQARTATPFDAMRDGADYLVVGRPIRTAPDPAKVAAEILEEMQRGLEERRT
jgi:orotidine-5'-phosphate decarboxylase